MLFEHKDVREPMLLKLVLRSEEVAENLGGKRGRVGLEQGVIAVLCGEKAELLLGLLLGIILMPFLRKKSVGQ